MKIIGLDPSTKFGVAIWESDREIMKTISYKQMTGIKRVVTIRNTLTNIFNDEQPDMILIEGYSFASKFNSRVSTEIGVAARIAAYEYDAFVEIPPTTLKKFVTGKGNAAKSDMIMWAEDHWGVVNHTDDEVDAYGLAMFGRALWGMIEMPEKNMEAVSSWVKKNPRWYDESLVWKDLHWKSLQLNAN